MTFHLLIYKVPANHSAVQDDPDKQDLWEELEETPIEVDEFDDLFSRPQVSFVSFHILDVVRQFVPFFVIFFIKNGRTWNHA